MREAKQRELKDLEEKIIAEGEVMEALESVMEARRKRG
jgi:hypothetical protein